MIIVSYTMSTSAVMAITLADIFHHALLLILTKRIHAKQELSACTMVVVSLLWDKSTVQEGRSKLRTCFCAA